MEPIQLLEIGQDAIWVLIKISAPVMLVALIIGLVISLFQALTQIQEMTLTFVPKIIAMLLFLLLFMPFIGNHIYRKPLFVCGVKMTPLGHITL